MLLGRFVASLSEGILFLLFFEMHGAEPQARKSNISKPAGDRPANGTSFLAIPNSQSRS